MSQNILYRLFGFGKLPKNQRATLEAEGFVLFDEGIRGSITYKDYTAPGKRFSRKRSWFIGSLVITQKRVVAFAFFQRLLNIPFEDPLISKLNVAVEDDSCLCLSFDASDFYPDRSGMVECRFITSQALLFQERLKSEARR